MGSKQDENYILLINPAHETKDDSIKHTVPHKQHRDIPPISLLTLGTYLENNGKNVIIVDTHVETDYKKKINEIVLNKNIILAGITTYIGNFINNAIEITKLLKSIKQDLPVVWGGPLVSTLPDACLKEGGADYVIFFNGEEPLLKLCDAIESMSKVYESSIPSLGYLKNGVPVYSNFGSDEICTDKLNWKLFGANINNKQQPYLAYIFTSRGCPYNCKFCYHQISYNKTNKKCMFKSADSVLQEMDSLFEEEGINVFTIGDDNFFTDRERAIEILERMKKKKYYLEQVVGAFASISDEIIFALGGVCQTLMYAVETASPRLLKLINKPIKLDKIPGINLELNNIGINTCHNFMFGLPSETDEERKMAVDFMVKLKDINTYVRGVPYFFAPFPGTPLMEDIEKEHGEFPKTLSFWNDSGITGLKSTYKYRPWINDEEQGFITNFMTLFMEIFQSINSPLTESQNKIINDSKRLKYIFSDANKVNFPKDRNPKYLLDSILSGKK